MSSRNKRGADSPEICNRTTKEVDDLIEQISTGGELSEEQRSLIIGSIRFSAWMPARLKEKDITIKQLQNLIFGNQGKKKKKKKKKDGNSNEGSTGEKENSAAANEARSEPDENSNIATTEQIHPYQKNRQKNPGMAALVMKPTPMQTSNI